jgi:hypothetical protein
MRAADLFTAYLCPGAMRRLVAELPQRAKPEALLIAHTFAARGLDRLREEHLANLWRTPVAVYRCQRENTPPGDST